MNNLAVRTEALVPLGLSPLLTTTHLMAYYGVSDWTVNNWVKRGLPVEPTASRGRRFDLAACQEWHRMHAV